MLKWGRQRAGCVVDTKLAHVLLLVAWATVASAIAVDAATVHSDEKSCSTGGEGCTHMTAKVTSITKPLVMPASKHIHVQDMIATLVTVCTVFCLLLAYVILQKPVPRLLDAVPREPLCWAHSDNLFVFTDLESDSVMVKNAGLTDIDLSACKLRLEHSTDRGIYYHFSFPEGYLLVAGTTVSVCYRSAAKFVAVPRRRADRLDSRTCPRLRWPPHLDGPVDSALDSASLFDSERNQIACESVMLQPASVPDSERRRMSTDSSDASFLFPVEQTSGITDWY